MKIRRNRQISAKKWSYWADLNRRHHPYQLTDGCRRLSLAVAPYRPQSRVALRLTEFSCRFLTYPVVFNVESGQDGLCPMYEYIAYVDNNDEVLWVEDGMDVFHTYALIRNITCIQDGIVYTPFNPYGEPEEISSAIDNRVRLWLSNGVTRTAVIDKPYLIPSDAKEAIYGYRLDSDYSTGSIVRYRANGYGEYELKKVTSSYQYQSTENEETAGFSISNGLVSAGGKMILADEETRFVVYTKNDALSRYYIGICNVPNVYAESAYAYVDHGLAKLIFIINASISPITKDVIFISGQSASGPIIESDGEPYYEYTAVLNSRNRNSVIMTIRVRHDASVTSAFGGEERAMITDGRDGFDKEENTVILNYCQYDADDFLVKGQYVASSMTTHKTRGVKYNAQFDEEIQLGTDAMDDYPVARFALSTNVRVYHVDGEWIEEIDPKEIVSDMDSWVYYVLDNGEITYLFISEAETMD